jgi:hypothetical protein
MPYFTQQTFSFNSQASILAAIGSIYISVFGILQMANNFLTKNSEDVVMANKLYKVKTEVEAKDEGDDLSKVVTTMQNKKNFTFSPWYQLI